VAYVACFWIAAAVDVASDDAAELSYSAAPSWSEVAALLGAAIGGLGAGFLWTAQGAYFARAAEEHARKLQAQSSSSSSKLAGIFSFVYLALEVALRLLSTLLLSVGWHWSTVFATYALVATASTIGMFFVRSFDDDDIEPQQPNPGAGSEETDPTTVPATPEVWHHKATAAVRLLMEDPKMKYMVGFNAIFGLASSFLNSYVNAEVVPVVFSGHNHDNDDAGGSRHIGVLTAWVSVVAAAMSLVFSNGRLSDKVGKGLILVVGTLCFLFVAVPFLFVPDVRGWNRTLLVAVYTSHGVGRATFEGTLKATFADYFPQEKEGAFANIILQNGLSSAIGYVLTFRLL